MTVGSRIKNLRIKKNYTLDELGKMIDASRQTLHKYEQGIITNIPKEKIEKIAQVLGVNPSYIYGWENDETYYIDENTKSIAQGIFENDNLRILFDASRDAKAEDLKLVTDLLLNLKEREQNGN